MSEAEKQQACDASCKDQLMSSLLSVLAEAEEEEAKKTQAKQEKTK